jgi:cation diffusion facilitator CzcD-associated flavoprotein CzcO
LRTEYPAIVIGAGPAGLATSQQLKERGIEHLVLERGASVAESWGRVYDSLTLHTGKHMSALPGMRFERADPLFVPRATFLGYLNRYRERFTLPVQTGCEVRSAVRDDGGWRLDTTCGQFHASVLVVATGIMANPQVPAFPGAESFRGRILHSVAYRRPDDYRGKRTLVIGAGNSGGEIASELARAGVDTTIAIRTGANVVPLQLAGIPIQYLSYLIRKLPRKAQEAVVAGMRMLTDWKKGPPPIPRPSYGPLDAIPLIGFHLVDAIREGLIQVRGGIERFTPDGVRFNDGREERFDEVILATGFRSAIRFLGDAIKTDARGFGQRRGRVVSIDQENLFFVGHNYDSTGGLFNIRRDAPLAAAAVTDALRRR